MRFLISRGVVKSSLELPLVLLATWSGSFLKGLARAAPRGPEAVLIKAVGEVAELTPAYTNGKI